MSWDNEDAQMLREFAEDETADHIEREHHNGPERERVLELTMHRRYYWARLRELESQRPEYPESPYMVLLIEEEIQILKDNHRYFEWFLG